jgi:hypothetical protein
MRAGLAAHARRDRAGGRLRPRSTGPSRRPSGRPAAYRWRCCRDSAGHRPRRSASGERGKRPTSPAGWWASAPSADGVRVCGAFVVVGARESRAQGEGRQRACRVWLEGQEVPGEYRDAVDSGYCESSTHRHPSRKRRGLWRARCVATRTAGSEVRAGETGRRQRRHRAPARPYDRRSRMITRRPRRSPSLAPPCPRVAPPACLARTLLRPGPVQPGAAR